MHPGVLCCVSSERRAVGVNVKTRGSGTEMPEPVECILNDMIAAFGVNTLRAVLERMDCDPNELTGTHTCTTMVSK